MRSLQWNFSRPPALCRYLLSPFLNQQTSSEKLKLLCASQGSVSLKNSQAKPPRSAAFSTEKANPALVFFHGNISSAVVLTQNRDCRQLGSLTPLFFSAFVWMWEVNLFPSNPIPAPSILPIYYLPHDRPQISQILQVLDFPEMKGALAIICPLGMKWL